MKLKILFISLGVIFSGLVILFIILGFLLDTSSESRVLSVKDSLDGKYTASFYVISGGGAAGWCDKYINVYPKQQKEKIQSAEYNVLSINCSQNAQIAWKSFDTLQIFYAPEENYNPEKKPMNYDKKINIEYIPKSREELPFPNLENK